MPLNARQSQLVEYLKTARTLYDVMEEFKISYSMARKEVMRLIDLQLVQQTPWGQGKRASYVAAFSVKDNETINTLNFVRGKTYKDGLSWIATSTQASSTSSPNISIKVLAYALAKIVKTYKDGPEASGYPSTVVMKDVLAKAAQSHKENYELFMQVLHAPIWDNDDKVKLLIGNNPVDWDLINQLVIELTDVANERGW